jgi:hypothetical protein
MTRQTEGMDTDWEIAVMRLDWDPADFPNESPTVHDAEILTSDSYPDYHPDVAWDPANGFMHVVWTGNTGEWRQPYRVKYKCWSRPGLGWGSEYGVREDFDDLYDYSGWAPRIAIGNSGFAGHDDIVAVVYSALSHTMGAVNVDHWNVGIAVWDIDSGNPTNADIFHTMYISGQDAGFPRVDLAPRHSGGTGYGSIVFAQHYSTGDEEPYHVIERNNIRHDWWPIENGSNEGFFGAVSIHPGHSPAEASISYFEWDAGNEDWCVTVGRFALSAYSPNGTFQSVDSGIQGNVTSDNYFDFVQIDTFEPADIVTINDNVFDNGYWLGYCREIDVTGDSIWIAYGDTTL